MKNFFCKRIAACFISAFTLVVFTACKTTDSPSDTALPSLASTPQSSVSDNQDITENPKNGADTETVTIQDFKGNVEIPSNPKKVVDVSGSSDLLYILGYPLAGTANTDENNSTELPVFLKDILSSVPIVEPNAEQILALSPDLVVLSTEQENLYEEVKDKVPAVILELSPIHWENNLSTLANTFGKTATADAWLAQYQNKAEEVGAEIRQRHGADTTYLFLMAEENQLSIFHSAETAGSFFYRELALSKPYGLPETEDSLPLSISYSDLETIAADCLIVFGNESDIQTLKDNSVWENLPAVQNGDVVTLPTTPYLEQLHSAIGRNMFIDEITEILEQLTT